MIELGIIIKLTTGNIECSHNSVFFLFDIFFLVSFISKAQDLALPKDLEDPRVDSVVDVYLRRSFENKNAFSIK